MAPTTATIAATYAAKLLGITYFEAGTYSGAPTIQVGAQPVLGAFNRITAGVAGGSYTLPPIGTGDAGDPIVILANESGQSQNVFPAVGEKQNGVANQVLAVPAGQVAVFFRVPNSLPPNNLTVGPDWRSAVIS